MVWWDGGAGCAWQREVAASNSCSLTTLRGPLFTAPCPPTPPTHPPTHPPHHPLPPHLKLLHRDAGGPAAHVGAGQGQRRAVLARHCSDEARVGHADAHSRHTGVQLSRQGRVGAAREQQGDGAGQQVLQKSLGQVLRKGGWLGRAGWGGVWWGGRDVVSSGTEACPAAWPPTPSTAELTSTQQAARVPNPLAATAPCAPVRPTCVSPKRGTSATSATAMASGVWSCRRLVA